MTFLIGNSQYKAIPSDRIDRWLGGSAVEQLLTACQVPASVSDGEYVVDDAEAALDLLLALQDSEQGAVLAWPRGQKIRLSRETGTSKMQLSVRRERDWFALDGQLQLDEDRVLELGQLMTLLQASPGRFVHRNYRHALRETG